MRQCSSRLSHFPTKNANLRARRFFDKFRVPNQRAKMGSYCRRATKIAAVEAANRRFSTRRLSLLDCALIELKVALPVLAGASGSMARTEPQISGNSIVRCGQCRISTGIASGTRNKFTA
jgi:hypothetical protein